MIHLCQNRPEGFGPHSTLHTRLPTTCFLDVIVEPLATWLFLVLLLALLPLRIRSARRATPSFIFKPSTTDEVPKPEKERGQARKVVSGIFSVIYYILIVAMLAMVSLEIARLHVAQLGIGLLPFTYVGVIVAVVSRVTWRARVARGANVVYWVMLAATMALKTAAVQEEQMGPEGRFKGSSGVQGLYPTSDEVIDNAVMVGVEVALALLEFNGWSRLSNL